ncbi:STAS domain-containing protein [Blastopirellula marina]|uniref:Anti-sigma factor antagonist n=1 Tax=Blastopirellula marina TaxID=124 RepID=A0A2S8GK12_9BACT|nr:STAS domain-containing protein [Blastopirellula marina]PQO44720.1 anti-sigma factor antagonist [Blastopirellula marina]
MSLPTEIFGEVVVVHTPEELGEDQADAVEAFLLSRERNRVIVDLDGTETLDSAGLTCLLSAQQRLRETGGELKITASNHVNRKILEITRLDKRLEVFENMIEAVKSFV